MTGARAELECVVDPNPFEAAAVRVAAVLERIAREHGRVRLAVPGGSAAGVASRAAELLHERAFDFRRLLLTWVDERCVPAESPESNRGAVSFAHDLGAELPLFHDGENPDEALQRVQRELKSSFDDALDVLVLGMGADGHVASLFVGRPPLAGSVAHVADSPKPPADRITLTRELLGTARHTFLVAAGEEKRAALTRLLDGDPRLPATGLAGLVVVTNLELSA